MQPALWSLVSEVCPAQGAQETGLATRAVRTACRCLPHRGRRGRDRGVIYATRQQQRKSVGTSVPPVQAIHPRVHLRATVARLESLLVGAQLSHQLQPGLSRYAVLWQRRRRTGQADARRDNKHNVFQLEPLRQEVVAVAVAVATPGMVEAALRTPSPLCLLAQLCLGVVVAALWTQLDERVSLVR